MYYSNPSVIISKKYSDIYDLIQLIFMKFELSETSLVIISQNVSTVGKQKCLQKHKI